jgi:hypothetical protein
MSRIAATIGILGLLAYPSIAVAADTSQCWQVQPGGESGGMVTWSSPNGMTYPIPANWDIDRAYAELAAAGLCDVTKSVPSVTSSSEVTADVTAEPPEFQRVPVVTPDQGTSELRARLDSNLGGNSVTSEQPATNSEDDWGSLFIWLIGLGAMAATAKDDVTDPVMALAKGTNTLPLMAGQHQPSGLFRTRPAPSAGQYITPSQAPIFEPLPRPPEVAFTDPPVDVPAREIPMAAPADNEWVPPSQKSPVDVAELLASQERPTFIVGPDRVGKGMTIQIAYRAMKAKGYQVWLIQPKPAPQEKHYWEDCDHVLAFNLSDTTEEEKAPEHQALQEDVRSFIGAYRQAPGDKKLLILDELFMTSQVWPEFTKKFIKGVIAQETSSGVTYGRLLWTITQNGQLGDIGISGGSRSLFDLVAIERPDSVEHYRALARSYQGLPEIDPALYALSESPKHTVIYHSALNEWVPMVAYPEAPAAALDGPTLEQISSVHQALAEGVAESLIVKDILGYRGRNYEEGKKILARIKESHNHA